MNKRNPPDTKTLALFGGGGWGGTFLGHQKGAPPSSSPLNAEIWPSRLALERRRSELAGQAAGGLLLEQALYTFEGRHGLLGALVASVGGVPERKALKDLAGPLLVHELLRREMERGRGLLGLARGRRFPHGLWRMLVQIRAAGLGPGDLPSQGREQGPSHLPALAGLLEGYEKALGELGLADEADELAWLEAMLEQGRELPLLRGWRGLVVQEALWLRPLDIRLLRALARAVPVTVRFGLLAPGDDSGGAARLLRYTAEVLEADPQARVEVEWVDVADQGGPLAGLAQAALDVAQPLPKVDESFLQLRREAGRYAEVEALVGRALALVGAGVPHQDIALVFPDLSIHGPMAEDVAGRWGLALQFRRGGSLLEAPLVQDVLDLLQLTSAGHPRQELARVWASPYLGPALAQAAASRLGQDQALRLEKGVSARAGELLLVAGYVDGRETPARVWLERAAGRHPVLADDLNLLAQACAWLSAWLAPLESRRSLADYAGLVLGLVQELDLTQALRPYPADQSPPGFPLSAQVLARDLASLASLTRAWQNLKQAALQVGADEQLTPGRLLSELRQVLAETPLPGPGNAGGGVPVLRLEDAQGIQVSHLLVGGLNQGNFPRRPAQPWLSQSERLGLGRKAKLPVWRTDEEEQSGQNLRLLHLLARAGQGAVLACAASDGQGRELAPSFLLSQLALRLERTLPVPQEGVYGELPPLKQAREPVALWAGISRAMAGHDTPPRERDLAQAALWHLLARPGAKERWLSLQARAASTAGSAASLAQGPARELLAAIMASPRRRRLSASQLEEYAACPQSWFLSRLLGLKPLDTPGWDLDRSLEGNWVHLALARFFAPQDFDPGWTPDQRTQRLQECLAQAQVDLENQGLAGHDLVRRIRGQALIKGLPRVVEREWQDLAGWRPHAVEQELGTPHDGLKVVLEQGPPLLLGGRLDRLDTAPGQARVVDYKHGRNYAEISSTLNPNNFGLTSFQVPLYLAAAAAQWPGQNLALSARVVPTALVSKGPKELPLTDAPTYLTPDLDQRRLLATQNQPNLFNQIATLWDRILSGHFNPLPAKTTCQYCDYRPLCPQPATSEGQDGEEL